MVSKFEAMVPFKDEITIMASKFKAKLPFMDKITIMAVGKSGVGKSTIGNFLLTGQASSGDEGTGFETSPGVTSCTQDVTWKESTYCRYGDVPGIPATNPGNTRNFFDIIAKEARTGLHVMLFVFKKDRIDPPAYERARLLFREFQENSTVPKVLVINDHTNYSFGGPPTEAELLKQAEEIQRITRITFDAIVYLNPANMEAKLLELLHHISSFKKSKSPHLRTYTQIEAWVNSIKVKKDLEAEIVTCRKRAIDKLKLELTVLEGVLAAASAAAVGATLGAFFTFGATLALTAVNVAAAAAAVTAIELKKAQLTKAKESISEEALRKASAELDVAVELFKEFQAALATDAGMA